MVKKYKILISKNARRDLKGIIRYIAHELKEPNIAKGLLQKILKAIDSLDQFPTRNRFYDGQFWKFKGLRFFPIASYLVFYYVNEEEKNVVISRIVYAKRDIATQLNKIADLEK